jgi:hypothetical protein
MPQLAANGVPGAGSAVYAVSAATVLKTGPAWAVSISVISAGTAGALYDAAATGTATTGKQIGVIPATVGVYTFNWPCNTGLVVVPGGSQVLAVTLA